MRMIPDGGTFSFGLVVTAIPLGTVCPCGRFPATINCPTCELPLCRECFDTHRCVPRKIETKVRELPTVTCQRCGRGPLRTRESRKKRLCATCDAILGAIG